MTTRATESIFGLDARPPWKSFCEHSRPIGWPSRRFCQGSERTLRRCCRNIAVTGFLAMVRAKTSNAAGLCANPGGLKRPARSGCRKRPSGPRWAGMRCCLGWSRWCAWRTGIHAAGRPTCIWTIMGRNLGARLCVRWPGWSAWKSQPFWSGTLIRSRRWRGGRTVSSSLRRRDWGRFTIFRGGHRVHGSMGFF